MQLSRRIFLQQGLTKGLLALAVSSGLMTPRVVVAIWPKSAFHSNSVAEVINHIYGDNQPQKSPQITIHAANLAENGAIVPIKVTTDLPHVSSITLLVKDNPTPLVAHFTLGPRLRPFLSTRIKMQQSSQLIVLIKSADTLYMAQKMILVTVSGCGS